MNDGRERAPGLSGVELVRHALSDMNFRLGMTLLSVLSVGVVVVYFLLLGHYGNSIYGYQDRVVDRARLKRLEVSCPDAVDLSRRFTEEALRDLRRRQGVASAFPRVEVGVKATLGDGGPVSVPAEGTVPGDALLAPARMSWGRAPRNLAAREAVLPQALFEKLGGAPTEGGLVPAQLRLTVQRTTGGRTETEVVALTVVGLLSGPAEDKVHVPLPLAEELDQWCAHQIEKLSAPGKKAQPPRLACAELRAYGPLEHRDRVDEEARQLGMELRPGVAFTVVEGGDVWVEMAEGARVAPVLAEMGLRAREVRSLRTTVEGRPVRVVALKEDDPRWKSAPPGLGEVRAARPGPPRLFLGGDGEFGVNRLALGDEVEVEAIGEAGLAGGGDYYCTPETLDWMGGRTGEGKAMHWHAEVADLHYRRLMEALRAGGLAARALTPVREVALQSYAVKPRGGERDGADLAESVEMARPTFTAARPVVRVRALVGEVEVGLEGSTPDDPRRFQAGVLHGRWLSDKGGEVVLPLAAVKRAFPGAAPAECVGRSVEVRFVRERGVSRGDATLPRTCRVVGVVEGELGHAPLGLLQGVALWGQGKVVFDETTNAFEAPADVQRRSGALRINVDAADARSAAELVRFFEGRGYRVEHRLAEMEGLQQLGRVLVCLVTVFVLGLATCASITVLIGNALHLASKTHEIGILRAHGSSSAQIVALFAIQGVLSGLVAFVVAGAGSAALEPLVSEVVRSTFRLPPGALPLQLAHSSNAWLFGLALGLSTFATTLGAILPAAWACRLTPIQAMQRQD